jgi:tRNA(fMet)-specific endonuclease VapC
MKCLLDTNVVSDFVRGISSVQQRLRAHAPADLSVSAVTVMEIQYGLSRNPQRARRIAPLIDLLIASIVVIAYSDDDARETGRIRAELEAIGRPIGICDAMLAGVARYRGLLLVTHNTSEFSQVTKLRAEDWRAELL